MKQVEAATLEEAYTKAATLLECSVADLEYVVTQYPSKGILGFMKKSAIIVASCKQVRAYPSAPIREEPTPSKESLVASEVMEIVQEERTKAPSKRPVSVEPTIEESSIVESFFEPTSTKEVDFEEEDDAYEYEEETIVYEELALLIEEQLKELLSHSCFDIDVVEVDVIDNTALIFIDGEDAALLIGKEGYRYNALSYMLFNWLHSKYELYIKLEIAEFLTSQEEMIRHYIQPVIENVEKYGKGKTRYLDGILVQIALEQLRQTFPNKYVAVKTSKDGNKFIVINEFNHKHV
jgi:spoIIIJ-associated protein